MKRNRNHCQRGPCQPLFSPEDIDLEKRAWQRDRNGYARTTFNQKDRQAFYKMAHRLVLARIYGRELLPTELGDHIDGNKLDNRRSNLRLVDRCGNAQNRRTSEFRGTAFHKSGKWQAQVRHAGANHYLGLFSDRSEAAAAAQAKREELGFL